MDGVTVEIGRVRRVFIICNAMQCGCFVLILLRLGVLRCWADLFYQALRCGSLFFSAMQCSVVRCGFVEGNIAPNRA